LFAKGSGVAAATFGSKDLSGNAIATRTPNAFYVILRNSKII